jgi:quinoprotein glucose dehydrogenase
MSQPTAAALRAADWPGYNRDLAGTRYSPLGEINTANVRELRPVWSYSLAADARTGSVSEGSLLTPIVVAGVVYVAAADRIVALRAEDGRELWRYRLERGTPSRHGLAYWPGGGGAAPRLFFTSGKRLIALEAATGRKARSFGSGGEVEMPVAYRSAPTVFESLIVVGADGPPGGVRAFDARSGDEVWMFDARPDRGEPGGDTWPDSGWREHASILHSAFSFTVDVDRAILYAAFDGPEPDRSYGGHRAGDTLFGSSVVALDVRTGRRLWHFQAVHHDLWGYDLPAAPGLLDVTIDGDSVPILAQAGKSGYLYVLNRVTGEPVFEIEERPVPRSGVPGEQSAPTQPIPSRPPPIARVSYAPEDLVSAEDTTAEHARYCRELSDRSGALLNEGPFTPYAYRAPGTRPRSTVVFPGSTGGASWGGTAADPRLGYVFVNTTDVGGIGWIEPMPIGPAAAESGGGAPQRQWPYRQMSVVGGPQARFWASDTPPESSGNALEGGELAWPCQKPPWGRLVAANARTGELVWQVPLGVTEQLPEARRRTGRPNAGGPIATAGGLVFIGATNDRRFRAFDSRTGAELWSAELEMSAHAVPVTYQGDDGKQYVGVVAAGATAIDDRATSGAEALVVYALP